MPTIKRKERPESEWKRPDPPGPFAAWGGPPWTDEADEIRVPGYRLVRGPDGSLVGVTDPPEPKEPE